MGEIKKDLDGLYYEEAALRNFIQIILKRKKIILATTIAGFLMAWLIAHSRPVLYEVRTTLLIAPPRFKTSIDIQQAKSYEERASLMNAIMLTTLSVETYEGIAMSPAVMEKVIKELGLKDVSVEDLTDAVRVELWDEKKEKRSRPYGQANASLMNLIVKAGTAELARDIANKWADVLLEENKEINSKETTALYEFIIRQYRWAENNLEKAEIELRDFEAKNNTSLMNQQLKIKEERLRTEVSELNKLKPKIKELEVKIDFAKKELAKRSRFITISKAIQDEALWQQLSEQEKHERLRLKEEMPDPIYAEMESIVIKNELQLATLIPKKKDIETDIEILKKEMEDDRKALIGKTLELNRLKRDLEAYQNAYKIFNEKKLSAEIASKEESIDIKIISRAVLPTTPVTSRKGKDILFGSLIGLFIGVVVNIVLEYIAPKKSL